MPIAEFRTANWIKRINRGLQIALAISLLTGLHYLASRHFYRLELQIVNRPSLTAETQAYLDQLDEEVEVVATIAADSPKADEQALYRYVRRLLLDYQYASRHGGKTWLKTEFVNLYREPLRAAELSRQYNLDQPNLVLFRCGSRQRIIVPSDIFDFTNGLPSVAKGEQAFTSALVEVASQDCPKLYFLAGHGEMQLDDPDSARGLSVMAGELKARNFTAAVLDLTSAAGIPADAAAVLIVDPQGPLASHEVDALRAYLMERAGRLIVLINPASRHGLDDLFYEWGILADDMAVLETGADYQRGLEAILLRQFGRHPITDSLLRNQTPVLAGLCRPVREDPGSPIDGRRQVTALLASSKSSWAERLYRSRETPRYEASLDLPGPVPVAAVSERRMPSTLGIHLASGRLIVFGSGGLFSNRLFSSYGNFTLFFGSINWMLNRDRMLAIPPRPLERYQIPLSREEESLLAGVLAILPAGTGILGLILLWLRRR